MNRIKISKVNYFLSNLNFIISLIGYPVFTIIMFTVVGNVSQTTSLTIPFRFISIIITVIVIALNLRVNPNLPIALKVFFFFWILLLIRMFFDLELSEFIIPLEYRQRLWLYAIGLSFMTMYSIVKSARNIDMNVCLKLIYILLSMSLVISFFTTIDSSSNLEQISGNVALDTISFSNFAVFTIILSIYYLINKKRNFKTDIIYIVILLLSFYIAFRTGSRGPILSLIVVLTFWYSSKDRSIILLVARVTFVSVLFLFSYEIIIDLISNISPVFSKRFEEALSGDDLSVALRYESYDWFLNEIYKSPIIGSHFARLQDGMFPGYAHNIFLDILLGFGLLGLIVFLYVIVKALKITRESIIIKENYWIGLLMLQNLILSFSSGAFYNNPILNISIVATFMLLSNNSNKRKILYTEIF